jgi:hypothetical protein
MTDKNYDYITIPLGDSTRARYTRDARRLHTILNLPAEHFDLAYFSNNQNIPAIRLALDSLDVGVARRMEYVRILCSILGALRVPHRELLNLLKEYRCAEGKKSEEKRESEERWDENVLETVQADPNADKGVRVLCTLLSHGIKADISSIVKAKLDISGCCLYTDKKKIQLTAECAAALQDAIPLNDTVSRVSRAFKARIGRNYSEFKVKSSEDRGRAEKPEEMEAAHDCQDSTGYYQDWDSLDIVDIHKDNIRHLCRRLGLCGCRYNWTYFNQAETLQKIRELADISDNTRINYLTALCVIMEETAGSMYNEYAIYRQELILAMSKQNLTRQVHWFPDIYQRVATLVNDETVNKSIRILALIVTDNVRIDSDGQLAVSDCQTETGVLRPSDLVNTLLRDGESEEDVDSESVMSLSAGYWLIREDYTKNRVERRLQLSPSLVKGIRQIYGQHLPKYLIVAKDGERYRAAISSMFEEYFGAGFDDVRSSYFTWREQVTPATRRGELLELCRRQGHQYSTAMMNYKRVPKTPYD